MRGKNELQVIFNQIASDQKKLCMKDQYDIEVAIKEVNKILLDFDFESTKEFIRSLDVVNDVITDLISSELFLNNTEFQRIFVIGELNALSRSVFESTRIMEERITLLADKRDKFLANIIETLGTSSILTHHEMAKEMNLSPAALTMNMKRNDSWRRYISSYTNPKKTNSVIYVLNGDGKKMYEDICRKKQIFDLEHLLKNYDNFDLGGTGTYEYPKTNPIGEFGKLGTEWKPFQG